MPTDQYFQPLNAPITNRPRVKNSFDFDGTNEVNSIDLKKIRNFNFSSGQGGTLTLGGIANGNGILKIKDSSGSVIILGDNTGLTITGGNITINGGSLAIYDSNGSAMIDSRGVNSLNQFPSGQLFNNAIHDTTSTSFVDVTTDTITLFNAGSVNVNVVFGINVVGLNTQWISNNYYTEAQLYDTNLGTATVGGIDFTGQAATHVTFPSPGVTSVTETINSQYVSQTEILSITPGTHTYKMQYKAVGGGTAEISTYGVSLVILGK